MRFSNIFTAILVACVILVSGCATVQPIRFVSDVDSLAQADAIAKKRYVLMPGKEGVEADDLEFQEFATYIEKVLTEKGFVKVRAFQDADVAIFLAYAIGDPRRNQYSNSFPTLGQTGVSSASGQGPVSSSGNTAATYSGTTADGPEYAVSDSSTHIDANMVYTRFLFLDAYNVAAYIREKKMDRVWKTHVVSTGASNDLRLVVPYMVYAMKPYLGVNTGKKVVVEVLENDPAVQLLRGDQPPANFASCADNLTEVC